MATFFDSVSIWGFILGVFAVAGLIVFGLSKTKFFQSLGNTILNKIGVPAEPTKTSKPQNYLGSYKSIR